MTNRELLHAPKEKLNAVDKQRLFLLRVDGQPMPCPACKTPINFFDAAGIDLDAYDFGATKPSCRCQACGAELEQVVPAFVGGQPWHWQLKDSWLQDRLEKARLFDQEEPAKPGQQLGLMTLTGGAMLVDMVDGACRTCRGQLRIIGVEDDSMQVRCENPSCQDAYEVETDAFNDGGLTYYLGFLTTQMKGHEE